MRRQRRTKIVATLGPASSDPEMIAKQFETGADVFRINMSHTNPDACGRWWRNIRAVEKRATNGRLAFWDLQGPKLRVGEFKTDS